MNLEAQANIPEYMKQFRNWIVFNIEDCNGKKVKIPYNPHYHKDLASTTNPEHWSDFDTAVAVCNQQGFGGVGFVFNDEANITGIDLDHCIDENGVLSDFAASIIDECDTYCEVSPSGRGLHLYCLGAFSGNGVKTTDIEVYCRERYFTTTGMVFGEKKPIRDTPDRIKEITLALGEQGLISQSDKATVYSDTAHNPTGHKETKTQNQDTEYLKPSLVVDNQKLESLIKAFTKTQQGKEVWRRTFRMDKDYSQSSYDYMLALIGFDMGFTDVEIQELIWQHRKLHGEDYRKAERKSYIGLTLFEARKHWQSRTGVMQRKPQPLSDEYLAEHPQIETLSPDQYFIDAFDAISQPIINEWLVDEVLPSTGLHYIAGPAGSKKSFLAIEIAYSIATGAMWHGRDVDPGQVIYLAGESRRSLGRRLAGLDNERKAVLKRNQLLIVGQQVMVDAEDQASALVKMIEARAEGVKLIVIDTKSSCCEGVDTDHRDVSRLLNILNGMIDYFDCTILLVDHTPIDNNTRLRGSGMQIGAAESAMIVEPDEDDSLAVKLKWLKQGKDGGETQDFNFRFKKVELPSTWNDHKNRTQTTLVPFLENTSAPVNVHKAVELTDSKRECLALVAEMQKNQEAEINRRTGGDVEVGAVHVLIEDIKSTVSDRFGRNTNIGKLWRRHLNDLANHQMIYMNEKAVRMLKKGTDYLGKD